MHYKKGYKYQLAETETLKVSGIYAWVTHDWIRLEGCRLWILKGYAWDGCSGPTWDDKTNMTAGLVHDALYQLMREGLLPQTAKAAADEMLYRLCIKNGMWEFRARYYLWAVKKFGRKSTDPKSERKLLTAP